jgi:hypothetical protein
MAKNVQGELSTHSVIVPELSGKKPARPLESVGHDLQIVGVIERLDPARWDHLFTPMSSSWRENRDGSMISAESDFFVPISWIFGEALLQTTVEGRGAQPSFAVAICNLPKLCALSNSQECDFNRLH